MHLSVCVHAIVCVCVQLYSQGTMYAVMYSECVCVCVHIICVKNVCVCVNECVPF